MGRSETGSFPRPFVSFTRSFRPNAPPPPPPTPSPSPSPAAVSSPPCRLPHASAACRRLPRNPAGVVGGEEPRRRWAMERKVLVVCAVVGFLGVLSAALGFAAEATRIKVSDVQTATPGECIYPRSPALVLGLASAVALMMAQAIINAVAGCICCKKRPESSGTNWTIGITFVIAFLLLLTGAALNDQHGAEKIYLGSYCYVVKSGVFSGGAALSLASVSLGIVYYVALSSCKQMETWGPQQHQGIALGRPQSTQPVFVHEDTYNRRQIP
ncbi:hypothetical protein Taro_024609 [Colocasia esculenta]|uniref:Uncharacterized protein n=1 Tax=Colocasia esculenta TaxID=4460 RepID=A0A843VE52_COLES|nr:hypothetical protein [Colocasia esculenta]